MVRLLNVLSVVSWVNSGELAAYSASKSAAWSLTNALRIELAAQKTQVMALHMGFVDTDLASAFDAPKSSAEEIVKRALDGLESDLDEVLADERPASEARHDSGQTQLPTADCLKPRIHRPTRPLPTKTSPSPALTEDPHAFRTSHLAFDSARQSLVMAPMTRSRAVDANTPNALMAEYYGQRASAGLIIAEGTSPSPNGLGYRTDSRTLQ